MNLNSAFVGANLFAQLTSHVRINSHLQAFFAVFCLSVTTAAIAEDLVIPDRARLQAMSQEEYATYREQIQHRMDGSSQAEQNLRDSSVNGRNQMGNREATGGYGQGYGSRGTQGMGQSAGQGRGGGRHR
ncbi:MAG: hypothetical protein Q8O37_07335 [Sulfuricellaceae bacterium]|nr:hypothetical protein [Sulfuricellaceae bacterium]